jgi:hypothetical protein
MMDTWTCHVCGDERPDALISVKTHHRKIGQVEFDENIRYCNDREKCIAGAETKRHTTIGEDA